MSRNGMHCPGFVAPAGVSICRARRRSACGQPPERRPVHRPRRTSFFCAAQPPATSESRHSSGDEATGTSRQSFSLADLPLQSLDSAPARPGAYAIRDVDGVLRYAGYSRDVRARLEFHREAVGVEAAAKCHVYTPDDSELVSAESLEGVLEYWVSENGGVVPEGNIAGRDLWEKRDPRAAEQEAQAKSSIPFRSRQTAKRVAAPSPSERAEESWTRSTAETFRSKRQSQPPPPSLDDDYVRVNVDPLDPFSPGRGESSGRWSPLADSDSGEPDEDWIPIAALMGVGTMIYIFSVLSNALPGASPTVGL